MGIHDFSCAIHSKYLEQSLDVEFPDDEWYRDCDDVDIGTDRNQLLDRDIVDEHKDGYEPDFIGFGHAYIFLYRLKKLRKIVKDGYDDDYWCFEKHDSYHKILESNVDTAHKWWPEEYNGDMKAIIVCPKCYKHFIQDHGKMIDSSTYMYTIADNLGLKIKTKKKKKAYEFLKIYVHRYLRYSKTIAVEE